jgi:hypothetical protein
MTTLTALVSISPVAAAALVALWLFVPTLFVSVLAGAFVLSVPAVAVVSLPPVEAPPLHPASAKAATAPATQAARFIIVLLSAIIFIIFSFRCGSFGELPPFFRPLFSSPAVQHNLCRRKISSFELNSRPPNARPCGFLTKPRKKENQRTWHWHEDEQAVSDGGREERSADFPVRSNFRMSTRLGSAANPRA